MISLPGITTAAVALIALITFSAVMMAVIYFKGLHPLPGFMRSHDVSVSLEEVPAGDRRLSLSVRNVSVSRKSCPRSKGSTGIVCGKQTGQHPRTLGINSALLYWNISTAVTLSHIRLVLG